MFVKINVAGVIKFSHQITIDDKIEFDFIVQVTEDDEGTGQEAIVVHNRVSEIIPEPFVELYEDQI